MTISYNVQRRLMSLSIVASPDLSAKFQTQSNNTTIWPYYIIFPFSFAGRLRKATHPARMKWKILYHAIRTINTWFQFKRTEPRFRDGLVCDLTCPWLDLNREMKSGAKRCMHSLSLFVQICDCVVWNSGVSATKSLPVIGLTWRLQYLRRIPDSDITAKPQTLLSQMT